MTVLQTVNLSADAVKMRWKEPYVTAGLNQKNIASQPKGVVTGFSVIPSAGFVISVQLDPTLGLSVANVLETTGGLFSVTLVQNTNIAIDLTAQAGTTCYIALDAQYAVGSASAAQVKVVDAAELALNTDLVLLAKVNVPGIGPIVASHINLGYRDAVADSGTPEMQKHFNLIFNPMFEGTATGWTNNGLTTVTASTDTAHSGSYSLKLTQTVAGSVNVLTGPMPVTPGVSYRALAWVRSTGVAPITGGNGAKFQINWYDAAGVQIGASVDIESAFTGGGTTWEVRKNEVVAPALARTARARVFYDNCSGTLYVDDVEFSSQRHDDAMRSAVFGGPTSVADDWHLHTAAGLTYGGSPNWADGTSIPGGITIEAAIDAIPTALGGVSGAAKIGFTAVTPVDLTTARVDLALNELDDKKAGLAQANVFTKNNTIANTVAGQAALTLSSTGSGAGLEATGGATDGIGVKGVGGGGNGNGGYFETSGTGFSGIPALRGKGMGTNSAGILGESNGSGDAVTGHALGATGSGVVGYVPGATLASGLGAGVAGFGGATSVGVLGRSGGTGSGVKGDGAVGGMTGIGVEGQGGGASAGVRGTGGSTGPTTPATMANGAGVLGIGGATGEGNGLYGRGGSASNIGVTSLPWTNSGVIGIGTGAYGAGVVGVAAQSNLFGGAFGGVFEGTAGFDTNGVSALGVGAGHGIVTNGGATGNAIRIGTGHAAFIGGNPAVATAFTNTVTPTNILKAWARVFIDTGTLSIVASAGFNVSAVTAINLATGEYSITLAAGVPLATRAVVSQIMNWPAYSQTVDMVGVPSSTVVTFKMYSGVTPVNLGAADIWTAVIFVYGPQ